jgi:hypothetical protein
MSSLYIDLQSISPGYLQLDPVQMCEIMSIIGRIMRIIVVGLLDTSDTWTYLYKASCPVHPEALLALLITCQPFLCA